MATVNRLAGAASSWVKLRPEFEDKPGEDPGEYADDGAKVPADEFKKVCQHFEHCATKFGASAHVATSPAEPALISIGTELVKAFQIVAGTMMAICSGAGPTLRAELRDIGDELAATINALGEAVGSKDMATYAAKVLDRATALTKISTHNRAAIRRRILRGLAQLRDVNKELSSALAEVDGSDDDDDDEEDEMDFDTKLDAEERRVVEAGVAAAAALEDCLKTASRACMPSPDAASVSILEVSLKHGLAGSNTIDSISVHCVGGAEVEELRKDIAQLRAASAGLSALGESVVGAGATELERAVTALQEAVDAVTVS